ncbi:helix-turn-helix transcriptional regulator [Rhizobium sp. KVB221]|uniref:Helix-turn-helix transcriptional regulator n=1 Tax=Rhizobium setariae TaxID=2801340 RepID=A0A936YSK0_9HYPH|nr:AraC family transcriptional regulator [Rhizobium setariae]MBL0373489.1 helix-turn-helix transcriptional regulator [Rhizobium setariae]
MVVKVAKEGRIALWEGASLWAFDVPPQSQPLAGRMHSHHAYQLTLAAGGVVGIRTAQGLIPGPIILTAPNIPHAIEPMGRIALLFVEPESRAGASLKQLLEGAPYKGLPDPTGREAHLAEIWAHPPPTDDAFIAMGRWILERTIGLLAQVEVLDQRIIRVLDCLDEHVETALSASEAASMACLSESRFSHLFVEQVGLPFRTFVLWRRLMRAVEHIASGKQLTEAAHSSGFADSAHFSRTFRRMFGVSAASLNLKSVKK